MKLFICYSFLCDQFVKITRYYALLPRNVIRLVKNASTVVNVCIKVTLNNLVADAVSSQNTFFYQ